MGDLLWILPVLGCGLMMLMMVVMMFGMGKSMFSRDEEPEEKSVAELRAEQARLADRIDRLDAERGAGRETEPTRGAA